MTMRRIPIDVGKLSGFTCAWAPEPDLEYDSTEQKRDRESDLPLYVVGVNVRYVGTREAVSIKVQVPGLPVGLEENQVLKIYDLNAVPWEREGRSGINYRASAITPANSPAPAAARPAAPDASTPAEPGAGRISGGGKGAARE
jgi:hypothetical protein